MKEIGKVLDKAKETLEKERRELHKLLFGVVYGFVLGILGNLTVSYLMEHLKFVVPQSWWLPLFIMAFIGTCIIIWYLWRKITLLKKPLRWDIEYDSDRGHFHLKLTEDQD